MKKKLFALWSALSAFFILMATGCSLDDIGGNENASESSKEFRLAKFRTEDDPEAHLAQVTIQLPVSFESRAINKAQANTTYYECWGYFHGATRFSPTV